MTEQTKSPGPPPCWSRAGLHDFVTELPAHHGVSDGSYARAKAQWGEQGVLEMVTLVGCFATVCWVMNL